MIDRTRFLRLVESARSLTLGVRVNQLTIRTRVWHSAAGTTGSVVAGADATLADASATFTAGMVGGTLTISDSDPANCGSFAITAFVDAHTIKYANPAALADSSGSVSWLVSGPNAYAGDGTATDFDLVLPAHYKIREIENRVVTADGGQYETGDIIVDGITPSDSNGVGYTRDQLAPPCPAPSIESIYIITGAHPGEYTRIALRSYRAFRHTLVLRRKETTP